VTSLDDEGDAIAILAKTCVSSRVPGGGAGLRSAADAAGTRFQSSVASAQADPLRETRSNRDIARA